MLDDSVIVYKSFQPCGITNLPSVCLDYSFSNGHTSTPAQAVKTRFIKEVMSGPNR